MSVNRGNYVFDGPFVNPASLQNLSGVYSVLTRANGASSYSVVDIGESGGIRDRVSNHDREASWRRCARSGGLYYAAHYCNEAQRMFIEQMLRAKYNPPCGER